MLPALPWLGTVPLGREFSSRAERWLGTVITTYILFPTDCYYNMLSVDLK